MKAEEIKFKAQREDGKGWVYGYFVGFGHIMIFNSIDGNKQDDFGSRLSSARIISETICQFTTLKDKNGVEIYKGDKFQYRKHKGYWPDDFIGVVGFKDGGFGYDVITVQFDISNEFHPFSYHDELKEDFLDHIEIIGNIHDKHKQKQALIDMMRGDEELGLYDDKYKQQ